MEKSTKQIKEERLELQNSLQKEYDLCLSYKEKLIYIFKTLLKSQLYYLEYRNDFQFNQDYLTTLIKDLEKIENLDDDKFNIFLHEKLFIPLNSDHVLIEFDNEYIDELIRLYNLLKKDNNLEIVEFLNANSLETLMNDLKNIENLDETKFRNFIKERILSKIPEENPITNKIKTKSEKNITINCLNKSVILKINSFSRRFLEQDREIFLELGKLLENNNFENIIIDIRGNGGGTDQYFKYFSSFTDADIIIKDKWFNLFRNEIETCNWLGIPGNQNQKKYNKYLLVDNKVFSTAERLTIMCKENGYALVIGEPTHGEGFGVNRPQIKINNATIMFPIEAPINEQGNIDYQNCYRTIPDIVCDSKLALDVALSMINDHYISNTSNNTKLSEKEITR
jgi:hypothetical protein